MAKKSRSSSHSSKSASKASGLAGGIDRLDAISEADTFAQSGPAANTDAFSSAALARSGSGGSSGGSSGEGSKEIPGYVARAVMYRTGSGEAVDASNQIRVGLLDADGNVVDGNSATWKIASAAANAAKYFNLSASYIDPESGQLVLTLSRAGLNAVESGGADNLYSYVTITVDGHKYTMQLVVNLSGTFDSAAEDAKLSNGGHLDEDGLIHGEWHSGREEGSSLKDGNISSSELADDLIFAGDVEASTIRSNGGDDVITVEGSVKNSSINAGDGSNTVNAGGVDADAGTSHIVTNEGKINISNEETGIIAHNGGEALVETANADTAVTVEGPGTATGIKAEDGSVDIKATGDGDLGVTAEGAEAFGTLAGMDGSISIEADKVSISATATEGAAKGVAAESGGETVIKGETINITAIAEGNAYGVHGPGEISIEAGEGGLNVFAHGHGTADALHTGRAGNFSVTSKGDVSLVSSSHDAEAVSITVMHGSGSVAATDGADIAIAAEGASALGIKTKMSEVSVSSEAGNIDISAEGAEQAMGIHNWISGDVTVSSKSGDISVSANASGADAKVYGLLSASAAHNHLLSESGNIKVSATAENGTATGLRAGYDEYAEGATKGENVIYTASDVSVSASGKAAYGVNTGANAVSYIEGGNVSLNARASEGEGKGVFTEKYGEAVIKGESVDIKGIAEGNAYGVHTPGKTTIEAGEGGLNVFAHGHGTADALHTGNGGDLSITSSGDITLTADSHGTEATGMTVMPTAKAEVKATGDASISIFAEGDSAQGLKTKVGSTLISSEAGNVDITAEGVSQAYGINNWVRGDATVSSGSGDISVTASATGEDAGAYGLKSASASHNHLISETGDIKVSATAENGTATGLRAGYDGEYAEGAAKGENYIQTAGDVSIAATGKVATAVSGGANSITYIEGGNVTAKAAASEGAAYALYAENGGNVTLKGESVSLAAEAAGADGQAYGVYAPGSQSVIEAGEGGLSMDVDGNAGAYGVHTGYQGDSSITSEGDIKIDVDSSAGNATGVYQVHGNSSITAAGHDAAISIDVDAAGTAKGLATHHNANTVTAHRGDITIDVDGNVATGMETRIGSTEVSGCCSNVTVDATGVEAATGLHTMIRGESSVTTNRGAVTVNATATGEDAAATGMLSAAAGKNSLTSNSGNVSVSALAENGVGTGLRAGYDGEYAEDAVKGENSIRTGGDVSVSASGKAAYGVSTGANAVTSIEGGNVSLSARSSEGEGKGVFTEKYGEAVIKGESVDIKGIAEGNAYGVHTPGKTTIEAGEGGLNVFAHGHGTADALHTGNGGDLSITSSGDITLTADSHGTEATGMTVMPTAKAEVKATGDASISIFAEGDSAQGLKTKVGSTLISSEAGNVDITAEGVSQAYGINNWVRGDATVSSGSGDISVTASATGEDAGAYGLKSASASHNHLISETGDIKVSATAENGTATGLRAGYDDEYADGAAKGENYIQTAGDVSIAATGKVATGVSSGANSITYIEGGNVSFSARATEGDAKGVSTEAKGETVIKGESIDVRAIAEGNAYGLHLPGTTTVEAGEGGLNVFAHGHAGADALHSGRAGNFTVTSRGDVNLTANTHDGEAVGITVMHGSGSVAATGDASIKVLAQGDSAQGIKTKMSEVAVSSEAGNIDIVAEGESQAYGINHWISGDVTVSSGSGDISLSATATGDDAKAYGMFSASAAHNHLLSESGDIKVSATAENGTATGLRSGYEGEYAEGAAKGENVIYTAGDVSVSAQGKVATGVSSGANSLTYIEGGNVSFSATATEGDAKGISTEAKGETVIKGESIDVRAIAEGNAYGLHLPGTTTVEAGEGGLSVFAHGHAGADALHSGRAGNFTVTSKGDVNLTANTHDGEAVGITVMHGTGSVAASGSAAITVDVSGVSAIGLKGKMHDMAVSSESGDVNILADATGAAKGIYTYTRGNTSVTTDSGDINIQAAGTARGSNAHGVHTTQGATTTLASNGGDINLEVDARNIAWGLEANGGTNYLSTAKAGNIVIDVNAHHYGTGLLAADGGANNLSTRNGDVQIGALAEEFTAMGIHASGGVNNVTTANGAISVSATSEDALTYGLLADSEGKNALEATGSGSISVKADGLQEAYGVRAESGGENSLTVKNGDINVEAASAEGIAFAVDSEGGSNTLTATGNGSININSMALYNTAAIWAGDEGVNTVSVKNGDISIKSESESSGAWGVEAFGGTNRLEALSYGDISVRASGHDKGVGLLAKYEGENSISVKHGDLSISASAVDGSAWGMDANGGANNLEATGSGSISVSAEAQDVATAVWAGATGSNSFNVKGGDIDISAASGNGKAWGVSADNGSNTLAAATTGGISVTVSGYRQGVGFWVEDGGSNKVDVKNGDIAVKASSSAGLAMALNNEGGLNELAASAAGDIALIAEAFSAAYGLRVIGDADSANKVSVNHGDLSLDALSGNGEAYGMYSEAGLNALAATGTGNIGVNVRGFAGAVGLSAAGEDAVNTINGNWGDISVSALSDTGDAAAMSVMGGENRINSSRGVINLHAETYGDEADAMAMSAKGGLNFIGGDLFNLSATAVNGSSYALYASEHGTNVIHSNGAVTLTITAKSGALGEAWALFADDHSMNYIEGHSRANTVGDKISITGDLFAGHDSSNIIETGAGKDLVSVTGDILTADNGVNVINTGAGNDIIQLSIGSAIGAGSLSINAGSGYDTLVLIADSVNSFNEIYQNWLTELLGQTDHGLEKIQIDGVGSTGLEWLADLGSSLGLDMEFNAPLGLSVPFMVEASDAGYIAEADLFGQDDALSMEALFIVNEDAGSLNDVLPTSGYAEAAAADAGYAAYNSVDDANMEIQQMLQSNFIA